MHVVTGTNGESATDRESEALTVHRMKHLGPGPFSRVGLSEIETFGVQAAKALRRIRPQLVHSFTPSGAIAGRAAGCPTLYTVLGHPCADQLPPSRLARWLFGTAVRVASSVAVLSHASAQALRSTFGRGAIILPPGVRLERFFPNLEPRIGAPKLLFSGTVADRRKRVDLAISTLALLLERHPDARLYLSGEGDPRWALETTHRYPTQVRSSIDALGPGEPSEVPRRYREATLTILPAEHEAFGLALVESLASGTPVVCSPSGGMPEIVGDDGCVGRTASAATPDSLAEAVEAVLQLAQDRATPASCVERAHLWDWDRSVGPLHERYYATLVGGKGRELEAVH